VKILIGRIGCRGDVLVASAIMPALKKKFPESQIYFLTEFPASLKGNQYLYKPLKLNNYKECEPYDLILNLDDVYELRPETSMLQAFSDLAQVPIEDCELFLQCDPFDIPENYIVFHVGKTNWAGRNWHVDKFNQIGRRLKNLDYNIVCVGDQEDNCIECDVDLRNKTNVWELATLIKNAKLFVGIDSFPMHVSQAVKTHGVCFFGSVKPELRIIGSYIKGVIAKNLDCLGCHHRQKAPCSFTETCETGTLNCEHFVTEEEFFKEVVGKLHESS